VDGVGPTDRERDPGYGWLIVGTLGITETVSYGVLAYAFGVLLVPIQHDTGWSQASLTGAYSLALLVSGLAALRVGRLLDRRSPRLLMTGGSALAALLVLAWSRVTTIAELYLVFAGLGVAMALVLYEPAFIVITKWFRVRRNAALTTVTLVAAFASFVFSPLTERLVRSYGWRDAVAILALVLAAVTVPLHALVLRPAPRRLRAEPPHAAATPREVTHDASFWLVVVAFVLGSFTSVAVAVHLVPLLIDHGQRPGFAAFAAGLMGLAQIPGRVLFGSLARLLPASTAAGGVFVLAVAALALLALDSGRSVILVFVVAFGMSNGMITLLRATLVADLYGHERYGAISGLVSSFVLPARAAAPFAAALVILLPGGYTTLLLALAALSAIAALSATVGGARTRPAPPPRDSYLPRSENA
jgi:predicted MFS family arabinose efflux permease